MKLWAHQAAEYVVGVLAVAAGLQSGSPAIPAIAGVVILLLGATADGPLKAFSGVPRRVHQAADVVVTVGLVAATALGRDHLDGTGSVICLASAAVLVVLAIRTDHTTRPSRPSPAGSMRSEDVGRAAGRVAANGLRRWRARR